MPAYQIGKYEGKPLLAEMPDPHRGRTLRAYYIGRDDLVGMHDGIDSWIMKVGAGAYAMKLEEKIAAFHSGSLSMVRPRRKLVEEQKQIMRRRVRVQ